MKPQQTHIVNHLNLGGKCACSPDAVGYKWIFPNKVDCPECLAVMKEMTESQYPDKTIK